MNTQKPNNFIWIVPILLGCAGYALWISWNLRMLSFVLFGTALFCLLRFLIVVCMRLHSFHMVEKILFVVLVCVWGIHAVGIFVPEVGFDAVWYHLPIAAAYIQENGAHFLPEVYQSAGPRLGEMLFVLPLYVGKELGVKLLCYAVALCCVVVLYWIARKELSRKLSLVTVLVFSLFHVVSWQSSSAYVDLIRLLFELVALYGLVYGFSAHRHERGAMVDTCIAGVCMGFALATKLLALTSFFFLLFPLLAQKQYKKCIVFVVITFVIVAPWYWQAYAWTGNPLYPLFSRLTGVEILADQGFQSWSSWMVHQLVRIPLLPVSVYAWNESATTPLYVFGFPFLIFSFRFYSQRQRQLLLVAVCSVLSWWFLPPQSVRYALLGFSLLLVLTMVSIARFLNRPVVRRMFFAVLIVSLCTASIVRVGAIATSVPYLLGKETKEAYVQRYAVGILKGPLEQWYGLSDLQQNHH